MHQFHQRIDAMGGSGFFRDYHNHWAANLRAAGLQVRGRAIPFYWAIDPIPRSAERIALNLLPYLVAALRKTLMYCLTSPAHRRRLLASLRNRQELMLLDIGRYPRLPDLFGRFDTFLRWQGPAAIPTIIEANFNNVEGLYYQHLTQRAGSHLMAEIEMSDALHLPSVLWRFWIWLLERYQSSRPAPPTPTVGIIWEPGHIVKDIELPLAGECFRRWGHSEGIRIVTGDWRSLACSSRHGWTVSGHRVHVIWKNVGPFYPADICDSDYRHLSSAWPEDVCVLSDILGRFMGSKWLLEMLWNPQNRFLFSLREWLAIRMMVPWTIAVQDGAYEGPRGKMIPDLLHWLCRNRERLVLKPVFGSHAEGVLIGVDTKQSEWEETISRISGNGRWVAMLYVQPQTVELPIVTANDKQDIDWKSFYSDCNFYVLGSRTAGVIRRVSQDRLLNIARKTNDQEPGGGMLFAAHSWMGGL